MLSLKHANLLFDHIVKHSLDELFVTDVSGNVLMASARFQNLFRIEIKEKANQNVYALEWTSVFSLASTIKVLQPKKNETLIQGIGTYATIMVSAYPTFDENHELLGLIFIPRILQNLITEGKPMIKLLKRFNYMKKRFKK